MSYLIYHPSRIQTIIGNLTVHHDKFGGNEDPYIWNKKFLHTYCHITQLTNNLGQINFWVSGNCYPNFNKLFCDCVFVIDEKYFWKDANNICINSTIVDNKQAFDHHYKWFHQHPFKIKRRYTLKADSEKSFQPQDNHGNLIDIIPFLNCNGISTYELVGSLTTKRGSKPLKLDNGLGQRLYDYLYSTAKIKLFGNQIKNKHP